MTYHVTLLESFFVSYGLVTVFIRLVCKVMVRVRVEVRVTTKVRVSDKKQISRDCALASELVQAVIAWCHLIPMDPMKLLVQWIHANDTIH